MEWTKERIRELRLRMGWSQSDLARHLETQVEVISGLEHGATVDFDFVKSRLTLFWQQAESLSEEVHRSALAEKVIEDNNLIQLFQSELSEQSIID